MSDVLEYIIRAYHGINMIQTTRMEHSRNLISFIGKTRPRIRQENCQENIIDVALVISPNRSPETSPDTTWETTPEATPNTIPEITQETLHQRYSWKNNNC